MSNLCPKSSTSRIGGRDLDQLAADDLPRAVRLALHRVKRGPGLAVDIDDGDMLGRSPAHFIADAAERIGLSAIDRWIALFDHGHEDLRGRKQALDGWGSEAIGCGTVIGIE